MFSCGVITIEVMTFVCVFRILAIKLSWIEQSGDFRKLFLRFGTSIGQRARFSSFCQRLSKNNTNY